MNEPTRLQKLTLVNMLLLAFFLISCKDEYVECQPASKTITVSNVEITGTAYAASISNHNDFAIAVTLERRRYEDGFLGPDILERIPLSAVYIQPHQEGNLSCSKGRERLFLYRGEGYVYIITHDNGAVIGYLQAYAMPLRNADHLSEFVY
jgi:hypothetical protein